MPDTTTAYDKYTNEEFARRGDELFDHVIRPELRSEDQQSRRRFVAIDIESGAYEVDDDELTAIKRLKARQPGAAVWLRRVGSRHAHTYGAHRGVSPVRE